MTYYDNSCKFYYDHLLAIQEEPKMAKKLELGAEIPEFFFFYLIKIGVKNIPNKAPMSAKGEHGSFFELVKFITSLEASGQNKDARIEAFRKDEPSWYSQELLRMIAEQKVAIGIGKKKIEEILDSFVPLRRPEDGEVYDPSVDYTIEEDSNKELSPLEEAELYKPYVMLAKTEEAKTRPIAYPAMVQKKYDGTRRLVFCTGKNVFFKTRQGKNGLVPPQIEDAVWRVWNSLDKPYGFVLDGEFYVPGVDRAKSNGIANKKDISDQTSLVMAVWDFIPLNLYNDLESLEKSLYKTRYNSLIKVLGSEEFEDDFPLEIAEWWKVKSKAEALSVARRLALEGEEGGVLKDFRLTFKNGRSDYCIKLKQVFDCNLKIVAINPGDGKFANMVGSFVAESLDGMLKVSVSGMVDEVRTRKPLGREARGYWVGKVINITFLELNDKNTAGVYTLHSPQFVRVNDEVDEADDIETIKVIARGDIV